MPVQTRTFIHRGSLAVAFAAATGGCIELPDSWFTASGFASLGPETGADPPGGEPEATTGEATTGEATTGGPEPTPTTSAAPVPGDSMTTADPMPGGTSTGPGGAPGEPTTGSGSEPTGGGPCWPLPPDMGDSRGTSGAPGTCGDGLVDPGEVCDDGVNDGSYGGCMPGCGARGPFCGDGVVQGDEQCDGGLDEDAGCGAPGPTGQPLRCIPGLCRFDPRPCVVCGNGLVEPGELCDGDDVGQATCESLGFAGGALGCLRCRRFDVSGCHHCGDGVIDPGETCDGADLGGVECVSLGFAGGVLACEPGCAAFELGGCVEVEPG